MAFSASTRISDCAGGTTSSSDPWSRIIGHEIMSTKWIGDRARYSSAASGYGPTSVCSYRDSNLWVPPAGERLQVRDAVVAGAGGEVVVERQRAQRRVPAGAATTDQQPFAVDVALVRQVSGGVDAVHGVDDAPVAVQPLAIRAPVARAARRSSRRRRRTRGWSSTASPGRTRRRRPSRTAVAHHDQRWQLVRWPRGPVRRRVEERVRGEPTLGGELDRPRRGQELRRDRDLVALLQHIDRREPGSRAATTCGGDRGASTDE